MKKPDAARPEGSDGRRGTQKKESIDSGDLVQIIIGSFGGAFAFAPTEEFHLISREIPWPKLSILFFSTLVFIGLIAYCMGVRRLAPRNIRTLALIPVRILVIYGISVLACLLALWIYDMISLQTPPAAVLKLLVVLALPATAGGTLVDLIGTKHRQPGGKMPGSGTGGDGIPPGRIAR